ncbi:hypothetical protein [Stieleria mannarensis]|uniref:hypothetical protein n=1 Tax=Stieleria mannarensis TaxID=2755585 RepID=UPI0025702006|nr:hypothetical protein [Rhodopirellula sp. JC639]
MTISGPEMHRLLMDGYKDVQQRLDEMRSKISSIDSQRDQLGDDRSDALVSLAEYYLPELTRDAIESSWGEVRDRVRQVLMRKEDHRRRVSSALADANERRTLQEDRLLEINSEFDEAKLKQDELAAKVESELAADETFVSLSQRAAMAEAALERAEANLNEIEQDAARKLPGYENSSLFTYLRDQNYGTDRYGKRGFTRRMDRWLAKYIDYHKASQSYRFLAETPDQMRKIIADDRAALDTVMDELEKRRDLVVKRLGLAAAVAKAEQLGKRRESQLVELDKTRDETDTLERELTDLEDTRGEYYREAVSAIRQQLAEIDTRDLASNARRTPSLTDDQIVARIQGVDQQLDDLDGDTRRHHDDIRDMQRCIEALGRLMQRFRAAKFDAARSHFEPSLDILDLLHRAKNERDIDDAWDRLRSAQRWGPTIGKQLGNVASHPMSQVLIGAMALAAGAAMKDHAGRAARRRER